MINKLKYLIKMSLNKKIKSKWFIAINTILVILIISLINLDTIIASFGGDFNKPTNIIVRDDTNEMYNSFKTNLELSQNYLTGPKKITINQSAESKEEITKKIENTKNIAIILTKDDANYIKAEAISDDYADTILYQLITSAINSSKVSYALSKSNINQTELALINAPVTIDRQILDKSKSEKAETMNFIMGFVFPIFILPFFMLIIFLVQMIGGEINEEKTTRSMEIIISNVSPKIHFLSKVIATNLFVFIQFMIMFIASAIGLLIRVKTTTSSFSLGEEFDWSSIWDSLVSSGITDRLIYVIPITIIIMVLSFLAYSLLAGILASMTTSIEDFQQLQTPIVLICVAGYYLSMLAPTFEGSLFIKIFSYIPFISTLIAPPLLLIGQTSLVDISITAILLLVVIYLMLTYGMKIYKVGILNYSTSKLWQKMFKAVKN